MPPRIVFMGTPDFAARCLEACFQVGEVVAVITQPDRPAGRGQKPKPSPVKELASARGIPVLQPEKIRGTGFAQELRALAPEVCVVAAYGKILPKDVLEVPAKGCVNVHASLLPRFRGAAPIQWAIASGDERTGVCLMKMDEGMDTGPIISCAETPIRPDETQATLHERLAQMGHDLLLRDLPRFLRGELLPTPQPFQGVVMAPMLDKQHGRLDFTRPAAELERRVRAFFPWPGAFTTLEGKLLKVHAAKVGSGGGSPGEVLSAGAHGVEIACGEGSLVLSQLQPEGRRSMTAAEFLASRKIAVGSRPFGT